MNEKPRNIPLPQQRPEHATAERQDPINCAEEIGAQADPKLAALGWERRHLADPQRAQEATELYESLGFDVLIQELSEEDFAEACRECASDICRTYVLIHTRKKQSP